MRGKSEINGRAIGEAFEEYRANVIDLSSESAGTAESSEKESEASYTSRDAEFSME